MGLGNLLTQALGVIPPTSIIWNPFLRKIINEIGIEQLQYGEDVFIENALVQPVSNKMKSELQLASEKEYIRVFASADILLFEKAKIADRIQWDSKEYTVIKNTRWHSYDGWNEIICVKEDL